MPISRWPFARRTAMRAASYLSARMGRHAALRECMAAELRANGYHVIPKHYYSPIPDESDLSAAYWADISKLVGVEIDPEIPMALVEGPLARFFAEFRQQFGIAGKLDDGASSQLMLRLFPEINAMRRHYPASESTAFWMRVEDAR